MFLILWAAYWESFKYKLAAIISSFSSWTNLFVVLVGDNAEFLAFRTFSQLRYVVPVKGWLSFLNIGLTFVMQFIAIFGAFALYFVAWNMSRKIFKPLILKRILRSFVLLGITLMCKFLNGFAHAFLEGQLVRMGMVLVVQLFLVGFIYYWASIRAVLHQTSFFFMAAGQAFRLALYFVIFIESIINSVLPDILDIALSKLTLIIVIAMLCCNVLHILISIMSNSIKSVPKPLKAKNKVLLESKSTTTKSKTKKTRV